jgi:hypothetical protein
VDTSALNAAVASLASTQSGLDTAVTTVGTLASAVSPPPPAAASSTAAEARRPV